MRKYFSLPRPRYLGSRAKEKNRCRALTIRLSTNACTGSKAEVSSVMATYCILPQKAKALTKPLHRKVVALGGHEHAVGHAYGQIAGHNGDGIGERRLYRRGKAPVLHGITSFEAWDNGAIIM